MPLRTPDHSGDFSASTLCMGNCGLDQEGCPRSHKGGTLTKQPVTFEFIPAL